MICFLYIYSITIGCIFCCIVTMALNYSVHDFLLYGILWIIIWPIWSYFASSTAYWPPGYFYIVCYYLKQQSISIRARIRKITLKASRSNKRGVSLTLKSILCEHNYLCRKINSYNKYWRKYLTIKLFLFVLIISFLTYLIFMKSMQWFAYMQFLIILSAHLLLVFILTYSASNVSLLNSLILEELQITSAKLKLSTNTQFKV